MFKKRKDRPLLASQSKYSQSQQTPSLFDTTKTIIVKENNHHNQLEPFSVLNSNTNNVIKNSAIANNTSCSKDITPVPISNKNVSLGHQVNLIAQKWNHQDIPNMSQKKYNPMNALNQRQQTAATTILRRSHDSNRQSIRAGIDSNININKETIHANYPTDQNEHPNKVFDVDHRIPNPIVEDIVGITEEETPERPKSSSNPHNPPLPGPAGELPELTQRDKERIFKTKQQIHPLQRYAMTSDTVRTPTKGSYNSAVLSFTQVSRRRQRKEDVPQFDVLRNQELLRHWKRAKKTFPDYNFEVLNIDSCLKNSIGHEKISRLIVLVKELKQQDYDTLAVLKDISGEINAVVHRKVFDSLSGTIVPNCIIELQNILTKKNLLSITTIEHLGFSSPLKVSKLQPNERSVYLNIVDGNIKSILPAHEDKLIVPELNAAPRRTKQRPSDVDMQVEFDDLSYMIEAGLFNDSLDMMY